jgi:hypothetical protein
VIRLRGVLLWLVFVCSLPPDASTPEEIIAQLNAPQLHVQAWGAWASATHETQAAIPTLLSHLRDANEAIAQGAGPQVAWVRNHVLNALISLRASVPLEDAPVHRPRGTVKF